MLLAPSIRRFPEEFFYRLQTVEKGHERSARLTLRALGDSL